MFDTRRGKLRPVDAFDVGRLIVEELYAGERPEHGRRGRTTFRKIAADLEGRMSAQALYRCAAIYEMCRDLKMEPTWEHVGMSHLSLVLGLSSAQQRRLVQQTERFGWSVERLRGEAARLRAGRKTRKGRRPLPGFVRAVRQLERFTDGRDDLLADVGSVDDLDRAVIEPMLGQVVALRGQLDVLSRNLKAALRRRP
ncbi:MAG: hypothetical protein KIT72_15325 [Polyangiaceae bacterium]|nr:hypothetical protein [Polyangiaceae bacterium]MCW5791786.1 hypothetical protein [Polyangiaceae bacterium]